MKRFLLSLIPCLLALPSATAAPEGEGWVALFNGKDLTGWFGSVDGYQVDDGAIRCTPKGRNLYTEKEYANFEFDFEFKLTPGANNGIGIRTPAKGDAAYVGMEIQVLDDTHPKYENLKIWQFHGSIYGCVPAKQGFQKPVGEWNHERIICNGRTLKVILNGETIVDANLDEVKPQHDAKHPGLTRAAGHIAFLGHGDDVSYRNLYVKELAP